MPKEECEPGFNECDEDDPQLLAALDEAIAKANENPGKGLSATEVRQRLIGWITG